MQCIALSKKSPRALCPSGVRPSVDKIMTSVLDQFSPHLEYSFRLRLRRKKWGSLRKRAWSRPRDQICKSTPLSYFCTPQRQSIQILHRAYHRSITKFIHGQIGTGQGHVTKSVNLQPFNFLRIS